MRHFRFFGTMSMIFMLGSLLACGLRTNVRQATTTGEIKVHRAGLERHENGALKRGELDLPARLQGYPCAGWVEFYANGLLRECVLAAPARVFGHRFPRHSHVRFNGDGTLSEVTLGGPSEVEGVDFPAGARIRFGGSGGMQSATASGRMRIGDAESRADYRL